MKTLLLFCFLAFTFYSIGQPVSLNNKYRLALPDEWKGNKGLMLHLVDLAPLVFSLIKDKQMCLNCNASYTLLFTYDSVHMESPVPIVMGSIPASHSSQGSAVSIYEGQTTYFFKGSWVLMNKENMAIAELVLVPTSEQLVKKKSFSILQMLPPSGAPGDKNWRVNPADDPFQYIKNNQQQFSPTTDDILAVLEKRLRSMVGK
jgi:hypothetical protein